MRSLTVSRQIGLTSSTSGVSYTIEKPLEEKKARKNEIEVVRVVEQKLSDLRIREGDSSTESEAEADYYVDNETVILAEPVLLCRKLLRTSLHPICILMPLVLMVLKISSHHKTSFSSPKICHSPEIWAITEGVVEAEPVHCLLLF